MDLEQKAREWLQEWAVRYETGRGSVGEVFSLTWRDLGEDSDGLVFGILHPEQALPKNFYAATEDLDPRWVCEATQNDMRNNDWRRTIQRG